MNLRNVWLFFTVLFVVFVPVKIYAAFHTVTFADSSVFLIALCVSIAAIMVFIYLTKISIRNIDINRNFVLGILSLLTAAAFAWCVPAYFNDTSKYDFELQPFLMSVFSLLACITFILTALTFFMGKNILGGVSFFIFCPILWFGLKMLMFLSIYNTNADFYEVTLTAFIIFFLVYQTQVFSTSSNSNIVKLMYLFGMPTIIFSFTKCVPVILKFINNQNVSEVSISSCTLEILISLYILAMLAESYRQLQKNEEPVIRSVTI